MCTVVSFGTPYVMRGDTTRPLLYYLGYGIISSDEESPYTGAGGSG